MKLFLLNVREETCGVVDIPDELQAYYDTLGVSTIDIVTRRIDGQEFDIICDDEGLFNEPVKISAISTNMDIMLVGNLLFAHHDDHGNTTALSDADIEHLQKCIGTLRTADYVAGYPIITHCDYFDLV